MGATSGTGSSGRQSWRIFLALACVFLVVVAGTVQVAHTHSDRTAGHSDCSLCVAAHVAVHLKQAPVHVPGVAVVTAVETEPLAARPFMLSAFALFTRPPPAAFFPA
ncbi:MAG: hypothetical protein M3O31_11785 [Acidobacteriota bacterium]|nr:hypothetical protein [Acidobacteriota bacterium]